MQHKKPLNFAFLGIAGSGKGTQVELLMKYLKDNGITDDIIHAYLGQEFREIAKTDTATSHIIADIVNEGKMVPNFFTDAVFLNLLIPRLKEDTFVITDGYPRSVEQSLTFERTMHFYSRDLIHVIYIKVSKDEAIRRMKLRNRKDDTDEGIEQRVDFFLANIDPAIMYYENKPNYVVHIINGEQSIEDVHKDIIKSLAI